MGPVHCNAGPDIPGSARPRLESISEIFAFRFCEKSIDRFLRSPETKRPVLWTVKPLRRESATAEVFLSRSAERMKREKDHKADRVFRQSMPRFPHERDASRTTKPQQTPERLLHK